MFINRLTATLTLIVNGRKHAIPAGDIKRLRVAIYPWGFEANVVFWKVSQSSSSEDKVYADFIGDDPIEAILDVDRTFDKVGEQAEAIHLEGIIEERAVFERAFLELSGSPVLHRRYTVSLRDKAATYWSAHYPNNLLIDSTYEKLIKEETPSGLTVSCDFTSAKAQHASLALGLGADPHGTSFYDFIFWLARREGFGVFFDLKKKKYTLTATKPQAKAEAIDPDDVEEAEVRIEAPPRHAVRVMNGAAEAQTRLKQIANPRAFTGIRRDALIVSPIAKDLDAQAAIEREAVKAPPAALHLRFRRYPSITMRPQALYELGEDWGTGLFASKKSYRLQTFVLDAWSERQAATDDSDDPTNSYRMEVSAQFEESKDPRFFLREHQTPAYPFFIEGKVVSDVGAKDEETFQAYQDKTTKIDYHQVLIPLWNKKVRAPYHPNRLPGHFYFPPYRDQRVLVALGFDGASIERFLDWRPGARLPKESQGNHILLGKKAKDQTSLRHVYESSKPVLTVERQYGQDTQTITVSEGRIRLETSESKKKA